MTLRKNQTHNVRQAASQAAQLTNQRLTCEGCAHLRALRPMCMSEASPNFRMVRNTHQDRCQAYEVKGLKNQTALKPEPQPISRAEIAGEVVKRKHNRWASV
jgi:hypothetical protein